MTTLRIKLLRPGAQLPRYARPGDSGLDLAACIDAPVLVYAGRVARIPTGVALGIPEGHEGQVRPRSGLSARGIEAVLGTVDQGYTGEVQVILANRTGEPFVVEHGDRIAQLVIAPVARCEVVEVSELGETARGERGFGSTGVSMAPDPLAGITVRAAAEAERRLPSLPSPLRYCAICDASAMISQWRAVSGEGE